MTIGKTEKRTDTRRRMREMLGSRAGHRVYNGGCEARVKGDETRGGQTDCTGTCALAEHIDEVTLPTRPSYAKWTLQTGRPLNLICTSSQLPVKPRPAEPSHTIQELRTPVCLFRDRFPSRVPFPVTNFRIGAIYRINDNR